MSAGERSFEWLAPIAHAGSAIAHIDPTLSAWLVHHISARIAVVGRDDRYIYANRELLAFFGRSAEEVIGRRVAEIIGEDAFAGYEPLRSGNALAPAEMLPWWRPAPAPR